MNITKNTVASLSILSLVALMAGCAAQSQTPNGSEEADEITPPMNHAEEVSTEGLTLEEQSPARVAGTFARNGATLRFALERSGQDRHAIFSNAAGEPLLETSLVDDFDTSIYLGGKATMKGHVNQEAEKTGDASVFEAVRTSPELSLLPELKAVLKVKGVDDGFFRMQSSESAGVGAVRPQASMIGGWKYIGTNGYVQFWSWSWWGTTTVELQGTGNGYFVADFQALGTATGPERVSGWGYGAYRRQWWGAQIRVTNRLQGLCPVNYYYPGCGVVYMWMNAY